VQDIKQIVSGVKNGTYMYKYTVQLVFALFLSACNVGFPTSLAAAALRDTLSN